MSARPKASKPGKLAVATIEAVIERDGDCRAYRMGFATDERCAQGPQVHHRLPKSVGGTNDLDNLMLICGHHHHLAHFVRRSEAEQCGVIMRVTG